MDKTFYWFNYFSVNFLSSFDIQNVLFEIKALNFQPSQIYLNCIGGVMNVPTPNAVDRGFYLRSD